MVFDGDVHVSQSFGAEIVIDNYVSPVFVTCATDVDALVLTKDALFEILERYPVTKANIHFLSSRKNWEHFKTKLDHGEPVGAFEPGEGEKEVVNQIINLNHDLKALGDELYALEENLAIKTELLKVARSG
jgi:hypothetical protein